MEQNEHKYNNILVFKGDDIIYRLTGTKEYLTTNECDRYKAQIRHLLPTERIEITGEV
jgi:hypothetical protein